MAIETFSDILSKLAGLSFFLGTIQQLFPDKLRVFVENLLSKFVSYFHPYVHITFNEYNSGVRNEAYYFIRTYLGTKSSKQARFLKADKSENSKSVTISLDEGEEIIDVFQGIQLKWKAYKDRINDSSSSSSSRSRMGVPLEKNYFVLDFHERYRDFVTGSYLDHVVEEGKSIELKNRKRKLFSNKHIDDWYWNGGKWNHINFEHPATFDSLAMDPKKKQEIIDDLVSFKKGKDYYKNIGKAWKRGYLLYGPPGTGKSTMIAAIANFLEYDIYDLELTTVRDNAELKQLLIDTRSKSIIVIEDIDCSLDVTGKRDKKKENSSGEDEKKEKNSGNEENNNDNNNNNKSKVTLSGLLNFIDGIWSACGQERIIIFTTNHIEKLDPALIRRGRMDLHIEMSYCNYESFKILAKNYLGIDDSHPLFGEISDLLEVVKMSPCDVAENLMPKNDSRDVETCLKRLIEACKESKEKSSLKPNKDVDKDKKLSVNLMKKFTFFNLQKSGKAKKKK